MFGDTPIASGAKGGLGDLDALLEVAVAEGDEGGIDFLFQSASRPSLGDDEALAVFDPAAFEAELRSQWALPTLDVRRELSQQDALLKGGAISSDPFAADDFTDQQWAIVQAMKKPCLAAIDPKLPDHKRGKALRWIFEIGAPNASGLEFETACRALGARPFVIQALIQHLWYLRSIVIPAGLPYMTRPLAEPLESEAIMIGMEPGLKMAGTLWGSPSMEEGLLFQAAGLDPRAEENQRVLDRMVNEGFFGRRAGRLYFTSRSPERRIRANADQGRVRGVSWSGSFVGDDE